MRRCQMSDINIGLTLINIKMDCHTFHMETAQKDANTYIGLGNTGK